MKRITINALLVIGVLVCSATSIWAQATGGRVAGTITDTNAAVAANATITLKAQSTGQILSTQTNDAGSYSFPNVAVGNYTLTVEAASFQTSTHELSVALNQETTVNLSLAVAAIQEAVTVTT